MPVAVVEIPRVYDSPVPNRVVPVASYHFMVPVAVALRAGTVAFTLIEVSPPETATGGFVYPTATEAVPVHPLASVPVTL